MNYNTEVNKAKATSPTPPARASRDEDETVPVKAAPKSPKSPTSPKVKAPPPVLAPSAEDDIQPVQAAPTSATSAKGKAPPPVLARDAEPRSPTSRKRTALELELEMLEPPPSAEAKAPSPLGGLLAGVPQPIAGVPLAPTPKVRKAMKEEFGETSKWLLDKKREGYWFQSTKLRDDESHNNKFGDWWLSHDDLKLYSSGASGHG